MKDIYILMCRNDYSKFPCCAGFSFDTVKREIPYYKALQDENDKSTFYIVKSTFVETLIDEDKED